MTTSTEPVPRGRAPSRVARIAATLGWALAGLAIWLAHLRLPQPVAPPELDPSWQQALSYALAHGIRFGPELVFTFGPLGGPAHARYQPELYWAQILLFELVFKGLLVARWISVLRRGSSPPDLACVLLGLVLLALPDDAYYMATIAVLGAERLRADPPSRWRAALDLVLVAAISLIKFPYFVLSAGTALVLAWHAGGRSLRAAAGALGAWIAATLLVWTALGQRPWDLPLWVSRSLSLAHGYTESQASDGSPTEVVVALASLVLVAALLAAWVAWARERRRELGSALVVAGATLVAFRASFTFHGETAVTFFGFLLLIPAALARPPGVHGWRRSALGAGRALLYVIALGGLTSGFVASACSGLLTNGVRLIAEHARELGALGERRAWLEADLARARAEFDLPRTRAQVGGATIDLVGCDVAWILLNRFNWKPRPVLQLYSTSTRRLIDVDGEFFEGPEAPEFALLHTGSIDMRLAWTEDGEVLFTLLRGYRAVGVERGLVLLRRDPARMARTRPGRETIATIEARPGEVVRIADLPGKSLLLRFDIRYGWLGKLRRALYHAPITTIVLLGTDGGVHPRRIVPGMATNGILVRPLLQFDQDWTDAWTFGVGQDLRAFRVASTNDWSKWYEPTYTVHVDRCDDLLPELDPRRAIEILFGCFPTRPSAATGDWPPRYFHEAGREFVLVGPNARLVFEVAAGRRRLTGKMGVFQDTLEHGDGVDFAGRLVAPDGSSTTLFERTLDRNAPDALRAQFDLAFDAPAGGQVVLTTSNPPQRNSEHDLPFFESVEIH